MKPSYCTSNATLEGAVLFFFSSSSKDGRPGRLFLAAPTFIREATTDALKVKSEF